jgi:hypothetical protein
MVTGEEDVAKLVVAQAGPEWFRARDIRGFGGRGRFLTIPGSEYALWWKYWPA